MPQNAIQDTNYGATPRRRFSGQSMENPINTGRGTASVSWAGVCRKWAIPSLLMFALAPPLAAAEPIPVQIQSFKELAIHPQFSAPATVVSDNHSRLSAEISARILEIPVRVGDVVQKGSLLVLLEKQDFELALMGNVATLAAINAKLDMAKYELKRARSLSKKQAVSEQLLKQRETERNVLQAEMQAQQAATSQSQRQVDKSRLRAPFKAVVLERLGHVGELANPGSALVRIIDVEHLELSAKISNTQANDIQHSTSLEFVSATQRYAVNLRVITRALDTQARTQDARLDFTGSNPLPGATGKLVWSPKQSSLPSELVSQRDGKLGVFVVQDNKAHFVLLPLAETGRPATVTFSPDTLVITKGRYRLNDGDTLSITNTNDSTMSSSAMSNSNTASNSTSSTINNTINDASP
ncbi:MAG: efflux RND transporter periplasmic adaptor subunit [Ectothiorhodospiraceae bacterium]|nr:efflux RND transporter periplasmic adaptor subunit [Ectothiorhodospiraceae bacterium]